MKIHYHSYGKERIRITYLDRSATPHRLFIGAVDITLEGDFEASYTDGDNRKVVATDTMKNTVYVLAREHGVQGLEQFAELVARHFVETYPAVCAANVDVEQEVWKPMETVESQAGGGSKTEESALLRVGTELHFASAYCSAEPISSGHISSEHSLESNDDAPEDHGANQDAHPVTVQCTSGLDGLQVVKTAHSGFSDFHSDRYRTLKDCDDRLFATTIRAEWMARAAGQVNADGLINADGTVDRDGETDGQRRDQVRAALLRAFAQHHSLSVQETLHVMAAAVFEQVPEVEQINLQLPNQHHLLANLEPFGLDNPNLVFVGTEEPFGNIEATLKR